MTMDQIPAIADLGTSQAKYVVHLVGGIWR